MFNVAKYVARAIASVQTQSYTDFELIVVDDCSTDGGAALVRKIADADVRIRLVNRAENGGAGAARNSGLTLARGDWLALIDADDIWLPHRLERLLDVATETGAEFVADNQINFDDALGCETGIATAFPNALNRLTLADLLRSETEGRFPLSLLQPLISLPFLRNSQLKYAEEIRFAEDMYLYAQLLAANIEAVVLNEAMYVYTNPIGQLSRQRSRATRTNNQAAVKVWIADKLRDNLGHRFSTQEKAQVKSYRKRAVQKNHAQSLSIMRRDRRWLSVIVQTTLHPYLTLRYALKSDRLNGRFGHPEPFQQIEGVTPLGPFLIGRAEHRVGTSRPLAVV